MKNLSTLYAICAAILATLTAPLHAESLETALTTDFTRPEFGEENPAGALTVPRHATDKAFSAPIIGLSPDQDVDFRLGNALFRQHWQAEGGSVFTGLGPDFNATSCVACHINDGRGHAPRGQGALSFLLKVGIPATAPLERFLATLPDPIYGRQMQDFSTVGAPEYQLQTDYRDVSVTLSDGLKVNLRKPTYTAINLSSGPLDPASVISPRVAPQMIGLGLVEAIAAADILALADPNDANKDGISGRANWAFSAEFQKPVLGRFGLKAASPGIREQTATAFANDMGISNALVPNGVEPPEITAFNFDLISEYSALIGVPARVDSRKKSVLRGKKVFYQTGCTDCHRPKFQTSKTAQRPAFRNVLIWPYSDFLLHDMGSGLADGFPEGLADGAEWRTPPLWGIGLTQNVSGHTNFLHDGRARTLLEAILWHGGEGQAARERVIAMPKGERADLLRFLESL